MFKKLFLIIMLSSFFSEIALSCPQGYFTNYNDCKNAIPKNSTQTCGVSSSTTGSCIWQLS